MQPRSSDRVVLLGKTGAGKTSAINALFGLSWPTDTAVACTKSVMAVHITNEDYPPAPEAGILVMDSPGIAECTESDEAYFEHYVDAVSTADRILWFFQADTRVYKPDQIMLKRLSPFFKPSARFFICLNHVDQIAPGDWDSCLNIPSARQLANIAEKVEDVHNRFSKIYMIGVHQILPCAVTAGYGLDVIRQKALDWR